MAEALPRLRTRRQPVCWHQRQVRAMPRRGSAGHVGREIYRVCRRCVVVRVRLMS